MTMDVAAQTLAELRAEIAALREEVVLSRRRISDLEADRRAERDGRERAPAGAGEAQEDVHDRRGFFKLAGAAAVGAVVAGVAGAEPAAASTGGPMLIGAGNTPTNLGDATRLQSPSPAVLMTSTYEVHNWTNSDIQLPADHAIAVSGISSGTDPDNKLRTGVYGRTDSFGALHSQGVFGSAEGPDNPFRTNLYGVVGTAGSNIGGLAGVGGFFYVPYGVYATGVIGQATNGTGVLGYSESGVSIRAGGGGRILQSLRGTAGPPGVGNFSPGEQIRDLNGDLFICVAPSQSITWRKVVAQHPSYADAGGSINLFALPIRIMDTRGFGAPIQGGAFAAGEGRNVTVVGTAVNGVSVPTGAKGIVANVTAVSPAGQGNLRIFAAGGATPVASSLNFQSQNIANGIIVALSPNGVLRIQCDASSTHVVLDIAGFLF